MKETDVESTNHKNIYQNGFLGKTHTYVHIAKIKCTIFFFFKSLGCIQYLVPLKVDNNGYN